MLISVGSWGASRGAATEQITSTIITDSGSQGSLVPGPMPGSDRSQPNLPVATLSDDATTDLLLIRTEFEG